ncbi:DUF2812 domain-containing protein [Allofournierella sp.]|uniref:DUF2812 domain-containing protein n=1 Tax=Allofournierella sp. TaxID=1940256 RepID=UPI003AB1BD48
MTRTVHKLFWVWEYDKEEAWLNKMAAMGLAMTGVGLGRYSFQEGTPGEYIYRLQLLQNRPGHTESVQYLRFLEETGAEHVASANRWVYLRKKAADGPFELFSDLDSQIGLLRPVRTLLLALTVIALVWCVWNLWFGLAMHMPMNVGCGAFMLVISALLGYGFVRVERKMRRLRKEKRIRE